MMGMRLRSSLWKPDIAIDLGTAMTRISSGTRNLLKVPSMVRGQYVLNSGVIKDFSSAVELLEPLLFRVRKFGIVRPNAVTCVPSDITCEELDMLKECIAKAGASTVCIVLEPLAAAIGAGMEVASPYAGMVLDIGEGITDCAVIRSGRVISKQAVRVGCFNFRHRVVNIMETKMKIRISDIEAERIIREIGVERNITPNSKKINVRDLQNLSTSDSNVTRKEIHECLEPITIEILNVAQKMLHDLSPNIGCEIIENGIYLSGGGALLKGMRERLEETTHISVNVASNPLDAVVAGAREMLPIVSLLNKNSYKTLTTKMGR